jgi:hypothetical protein
MAKGKVDPGTTGMAAWFTYLAKMKERFDEKGLDMLNWVRQGASLFVYILFNCDLVERR